MNVHSIDHALLINNVAALARDEGTGRPDRTEHGRRYGSVLADPIFKEISDAFPGQEIIDRPSTNA